jgi:hypothetical protein
LVYKSALSQSSKANFSYFAKQSTVSFMSFISPREPGERFIRTFESSLISNRKYKQTARTKNASGISASSIRRLYGEIIECGTHQALLCAIEPLTDSAALLAAIVLMEPH